MVDLEKVEKIVRGKAQGGPLTDLTLGIDNKIRPVAQEKLGMNIACRPGDDLLRTKLLEQEGALK